MDNSFRKKLEKLESAYLWSSNQPITSIVSFLKSAMESPLICVGSGGSLIAACFASILHQELGEFSRYLTPLEFISSNLRLKNSSILIISAGGNNIDILKSLEHGVLMEPNSVLILTTSQKSQLLDLARDYYNINKAIFSHPTLKDGFLAKSSLLTKMIVLAKGYVHAMGLDIKFPTSLNELLNPKSKQRDFQTYLRDKLSPLLQKDNLFILFTKWSHPVALYIQSSFIEAGLGCVYITDYRSFAHGKHNWFNEFSSESAIIALTSANDGELPSKTLRLIPSKVQKLLLTSNWTAPISTLELMILAMNIVELKGEIRSIDPENPDIPKYGKQIFNLTYKRPTDPFFKPKYLLDKEFTAISRKLGSQIRILGLDSLKFWKSAYNKFKSNLYKEKFGAIVFDYDGTLCEPNNRYKGPTRSLGKQLTRILENSIGVGISSGRGKSVRKAIRGIIPSRHWHNILVGYYNGSDIGYLDDSSHPVPNKEKDQTILELESILKKQKYLTKIANLDVRAKQISVEPISSFSMNALYDLLFCQLANNPEMEDLQLLMSGHSIDILVKGVSKGSIINRINQKMEFENGKLKILSIGDKGKWPGNDFFLLNRQYSLSVDEVSSNPENCWNLAPMGFKGVQATFYYLRSMYGRDSFVELRFS